MNPKKENTPLRETRRRYEERNKEVRRSRSGNFQAMLPKDDYDDVVSFVESNNLSKVQFIKEALELMKQKYEK